MKMCECGCGNKVDKRFIKGHNFKSGRDSCNYDKIGSETSNWKGGKVIHSLGYVLVTKKNHPRADCNGYVLEHVLVAEKVLGKQLPPKAEIHHVDENRSNNSNNNLVICENKAYHFFLHRRKRAYDACGHVDWVKCWICKKHDAPERVYIAPNNHLQAHHRECMNKYQQVKRAEAKLCS